MHIPYLDARLMNIGSWALSWTMDDDASAGAGTRSGAVHPSRVILGDLGQADREAENEQIIELYDWMK